MLLTKEQISEQMCKHAQKKNGLHDLMEIMLESMMVAERSEFLVDNPGNKGNGYRPGSAVCALSLLLYYWVKLGENMEPIIVFLKLGYERNDNQ